MKRSDFDPISADAFERQLRKVIVFVAVAFGVLVLRLWSLQVLRGEEYRQRSEHNRIRLRDIPASRGLIFDSKGRRLAQNLPSYDLYVTPEDVESPEQLFGQLHSLVGLDVEDALKKLNQTGRRRPFKPILIKPDISRDQLALVETYRYDLPGIMIRVNPRRHYIKGEFACHVLGYLGEITEQQLRSNKFPHKRAGDLVGKAGTELKWDKYLSGLRGGEQIEVDAKGRKIAVLSRREPEPGANVFLNIDSELQAVAERGLSGRKGVVIAVEPGTGRILAMASRPSFDPNIFIRGIDQSTWKAIVSSKDYPLQNRAVSGIFPPGSVFKIVVALAALEEGIIDPDEPVICNGSFPLGDRVFRCWKKHGHGAVNLHRALVESCDVYFYKLGLALGVEKIAKFARRLGLGRVTGYDLGFEKKGLVPTKRWKLKRWGSRWQGGETATLAIGQGYLLVTPIQLVNMISAVFNGGFLYAPQVTKHVGADQVYYKFTPKLKSVAGVSPEHLERVRTALVGVVNDPHGTGRKAIIDGVVVAGKTGTAQVVGSEKMEGVEEDQVPMHLRDHAWFVAVAPAESPRIAVVVLIEHGGHGGSAAAPVAREVISKYLGLGS